MFTEKVKKIALSASDDNRIQSIDLMQTYTYKMWKELVCKRKKKLNVTM